MIRVDELLEEVRLLHEGRKYKEMIALLNDAILQDNEQAELYFHRAIALVAGKKYAPAIDDLTRAIVLKPDYFRAWLNRGITWSQMKQNDKAIADISKAIALRPDHASAYRYMGDAWAEKKEYDMAIINYNKAIELRPDSFELYLQRGTAWAGKKEYDMAVEDCNRVIALQPDYTSAYTNLGNALYGKKEYGKAIANYNTAIGLRSGSGRAWFGLGRVYEAMKKYELASMHYKRAYYLNFDGTRLVDVFKVRIPAPYIVKSLVSVTEGNKGVEANFSTLEYLISFCMTWDTYLDHLRDKGYHRTHPEKYDSLEAIVNYYMGNSIAAYRIFDTQFDSEEHPYSMTLRDQYYMVLSAVDFREPDNGLAYALAHIGKGEANDPVDSYYAGQLYLLHDDLDNALRCFDQCGSFLPALYGKIIVFNLMEDSAGSMHAAGEIEIAETAPGCEMRFLHGIGPLPVPAEIPFEETFPKIMQHVYYYELIEAIEQVRVLLGKTSGLRHLEFHALLEFTPASIDG